MKKNTTPKKPKRTRRVGHRKGRRNPPMSLSDPVVRSMVNHAIGAVLIDKLGIDFVGLLEKARPVPQPLDCEGTEKRRGEAVE